MSIEETLAKMLREQLRGEIKPLLNEISKLRQELNPLSSRNNFTTEEASKLIGKSTYQLRELLKARKLAGKKDESGKWRIPKIELTRYLNYGPASVSEHRF